jgi:hypothetical protein
VTTAIGCTAATSGDTRCSGSLLAFGRFPDDAEGILTGIKRLAVVGIERGLNLGIRPAKLRTTAFADGKSGIPLNDSQIAFRHGTSLAPNACSNETAAVPEIPRDWLNREKKLSSKFFVPTQSAGACATGPWGPMCRQWSPKECRAKLEPCNPSL